jgi:uncharacterized phage protein gp47/JayE
MSFNRPPLAGLIRALEDDFDSRLPGADARLPASNLNVMARVQAGGLHGLYGYMDWVSLQVLPDTAEAEFLDRHATIWGLSRKAAAAATGTATFSGNNGAVVPAGTVLQRSDGREYATAADAAIAAGTAVVTVIAVLPGLAGNLGEAAPLRMISSIAGVDAAAIVASGGLLAGADAEADTAMLGRLLTRIRKAPHGGARHDYLAWTLEVPGVTRAWVDPMVDGDGNPVPGTVWVRFVCDDQAGGIIPNPAKVAEVQAYLDARRPVTAEVVVTAPVAKPFEPVLAGIDPATPQVKAAVEAELRDLLRREGEDGATLLLSHIREAVSLALGERDHQLVSPAANVTHARGEIPVMGTITWA